MSYYVYGLRVRGDVECRYIGATKHKPELRLSQLTSAAREQRERVPHREHPDGLYAWLLNNRGNIEAFKIAKVDTGVEARAMEKTIIALVLRLGSRLLNVAHVPDDQRIGYIRTGYSQDVWLIRQAQRATA